ncbi:hypothetical protein WJX74_010792 [Apatococcus lobatus]|uniref:Uncharacterized protein n=1 Tax=Apatococcus lobatus TaxID=904363 RepID=A0AAW1R1F5_9CHLO
MLLPSFVTCPLVAPSSFICRQLLSGCPRPRHRAPHSITSVTARYSAPPSERACRHCKGSGHVPCKDCKGTGILPRGGYHAKNEVVLSRIQGSKWTALNSTLGWRHFHAISSRKDGRQSYVLLAATCEKSTKLWVNTKILKDRAAWANGWKEMSELPNLKGSDSGRTCKTCKASGYLPCPRCYKPPEPLPEPGVYHL